MLDEYPGSAEYFYPGGEPLQAGDFLRNPEYAATLTRVAEEGPQAFYTGEIAEAIVCSSTDGAQPWRLKPWMMWLLTSQLCAMLSCGDWRDLQICSATPPSSGAMQIMIANLYDDLVPEDATQMEKVQAFVDAQRLAYADRDYYFGDPDRVDVPLEGLLDPEYLSDRANNPIPPGDVPTHGDPGMVLGNNTAAVWMEDSTQEPAGTTHYSIVDDEGNAVSVTMTVESFFWFGALGCRLSVEQPTHRLRA